MKDTLIHISKPDQLPPNTEFLSILDIEKQDTKLSNVLIQDLLDYTLQSDINNLLTIIQNKLEVGGYLSIQGLDIKQLANAITFDEVDPNQINSILYPHKKSTHTMHQILSYTNNTEGWKTIIKKYVNSVEYFILLQKI